MGGEVEKKEGKRPRYLGRRSWRRGVEGLLHLSWRLVPLRLDEGRGGRRGSAGGAGEQDGLVIGPLLGRWVAKLDARVAALDLLHCSVQLAPRYNLLPVVAKVVVALRNVETRG